MLEVSTYFLMRESELGGLHLMSLFHVTIVAAPVYYYWQTITIIKEQQRVKVAVCFIHTPHKL